MTNEKFTTRKQDKKNGVKSIKERRSRRRSSLLADLLLLPVALILELWTFVIWHYTLAALNALSRTPPIARLRLHLQRLPPLAVLFLFLIPEVIDHLGGFWATILLVNRRVIAATLVALFVKGTAALVVIWIYQACEPSLMSVAWFAWTHNHVIAFKDWVLRRTAPIQARLRSMLSRHSHVFRRLAAWRKWLGRKFRRSIV